MAFNKYANGAWEEPDGVKRYTDGAWQDCESAKRYVDGAWEEVWSAGYYFLKNGVLMNGASIRYEATQVDGAIKASTSDNYEDADFIEFMLTSDMVGKTLYVRASSNVNYYDANSSSHYSYLLLYFPQGEYGYGGQYFTGKVGEFITKPISSSHVGTEKKSYISLYHSYTADTYYIYDVFVA
ncbi:MAG: hypothetical protein ACI4FZ_08715 [Lachnospiraceae bacterium]